MTEALHIEPIQSFRASLRPPGSKSLTNRALVLAALAQGPSVIRRPLRADDTIAMTKALKDLGFDLAWEEHGICVTGQSGRIPGATARLDLGNAGTAMRSLCAVCCLGQGEYILDGTPRMRQRPIGQLVGPLRQLGARIEYLGADGYPPVLVRGTGLEGREVAMSQTLSSQYISALLQAGPLCRGGLSLRFEGPVTSRPYVEMTLGLMTRFGGNAEVDQSFTQIRVEPGPYQSIEYEVEPDASNASYFLAAAAIIAGSCCTIEGLGRGSLQGDVGFPDLLHQMGANIVYGRDFITVMAPPANQRLRGIDVDLNAMPDMAQTLAAVALFANGPTTIRNVGNLRVKETDRLAALETELEMLGAAVTIDGDDLTIQPPANNQIRPTTINTYDDHRMAMSFAIVGLRAPGVVIKDPDCVRKTFPDFFEYLGRLGKGSGVV